MKRILILFLLAALLTCGCSNASSGAQIAATTLPVYDFTSRLCQGTDLEVVRLVTESVSCLHDYTLQVSQMRAIEEAELIVMNGAGLEAFLDDALTDARKVLDASAGIALLCPGEVHGHENDAHDHDHGHSHDQDSHIWLSPENAKIMARNICTGLQASYPEYAHIFSANLQTLTAELDALQQYGDDTLAQLGCRELITFHDGFAYFAESFGLTILEAVEEESGSEASAQELIELIEMVREHELPAIFVEANGSVSAASIISAETGAEVFTLDMAMASDSYFDAMYRNIDTIKEALE